MGVASSTVVGRRLKIVVRPKSAPGVAALSMGIPPRQARAAEVVVSKRYAGGGAQLSLGCMDVVNAGAQCRPANNGGSLDDEGDRKICSMSLASSCSFLSTIGRTCRFSGINRKGADSMLSAVDRAIESTNPSGELCHEQNLCVSRRAGVRCVLMGGVARADVCGSVSGNIVQNCGFESTSGNNPTNWSLTGNLQGGVGGNYVYVDTGNPNSGNTKIWLWARRAHLVKRVPGICMVR